MAEQTKSEGMTLNLHLSPVYASECILFKLSVDPSCLRLSHSKVPQFPDFSSTAYNIAVISNAISCANELRFPCISTSVFTATHAEILSVTSCLLNSVIIKTGFRYKFYFASSQAISNLTTTSPTEKNSQFIGSRFLVAQPHEQCRTWMDWIERDYFKSLAPIRSYRTSLRKQYAQSGNSKWLILNCALSKKTWL